MASILRMKPKGTAEPSEVMKSIPAPLRKIAAKVKVCITRVAPDTKFSGYRGWGIVIGAVDDVAYCYFGASGRLIKLGFTAGVYLPDPERLLKGRAATARHIPIDSIENFPKKALESFIRAGAAFARKIAATPKPRTRKQRMSARRRLRLRTTRN